MAEKRPSNARRAKSGKASPKPQSSGAAQRAKSRTQAQQTDSGSSSQGTRSASPARSSTSSARSSSSRARANEQNGLSASDAVSRAREALSELVGRPVEGVLGIDRDQDNWIATVQVVELARIPNTTDVLGDYETVLDAKGDVVSYHRKRRYHRGQVDGGQP
jgi:hypothetical protein